MDWREVLAEKPAAPPPNARGQQLLQLCEQRSVEGVGMLLGDMSSADVSSVLCSKDNNSFTPLFVAANAVSNDLQATLSSLSVMLILLAHGASADVCTESGKTALHLIARAALPPQDHDLYVRRMV